MAVVSTATTARSRSIRATGTTRSGFRTSPGSSPPAGRSRSSGAPATTRYFLGEDFGSVTTSGTDAGSDTIDLTNLTFATLGTVNVNAAKTVFTAGSNTFTQSGDLADEINVKLLYSTSGIASDLETKLKSGYNTLSQLIDSIDSTVHELANALPLIDPNAGSTISKIIGLVDDIKALRDKTNAKIDSLGAATTITLSDVVTELKAAVAELPALLSGLQITTDYRGAGTTGTTPAASGLLQVLIALDLPSASIVAKTIPLSLGSTAAGLGLTLDANTATSAIEPPTFSVNGTLEFHLKIGLPTGHSATSTIPFFVPGGNLILTMSASLGATTVRINLPLLEATATTPGISFNGNVHLNLVDPGATDDGEIELTALGPAAISVTSAGTITSPITITATVRTGITVGATPLASATLTITLKPNTIFGNTSGPVNVDVAFTSSGGGLNDLLDNFTHAGPNEILGMLGQVSDFLAGMANQQVLNTTIPFTNVKIGSALDYAKAFKHDYLDPLFKSGDSLKPDSNGDGNITLEDFNFASIQGLLDRLSDALGLTGTARLTANFNSTTHELTFGFSLDRTFGIGTDVNSIDAAKALVTTMRDGSAAGSEIQELIVNATSGTVRLSQNGHTTSFAVGSSPGTVQGQLNAAIVSGGLGLSATVAGNAAGFYSIDFGGTSNVAQLSVDSSSLTNNTTKQTVVVPGNASTFWLAYQNSDDQIELTGQLTKSSTNTEVKSALESLEAVDNVTVTKVDGFGTEKVFIVSFVTPGTDVKRLVAVGGLDLDFGAALGSLGGVHTTGSVIPLARLIAGATFGIDLSPSQSLASDPGTFSPGARVDIYATDEGGKGVTVQTLRPGGTGISEIQVVAARGASGQFRLSYGGVNTQLISLSDSGSTVETRLETDIAALSGKVDSVTKATRPEGSVYTITFNSSLGNASQLGFDPGALVAQNETQRVAIMNATEGSIKLNVSIDLNHNGTIDSGESGLSGTIAYNANTAAVISAFTGGTTLPTGVTVSVTSPSAHVFDIEFTGAAAGMDVGLFTADTSALKGALQNGQLAGTANFDASLYNGSGIVVLTTQDGTADVTISCGTRVVRRLARAPRRSVRATRSRMSAARTGQRSRCPSATTSTPAARSTWERAARRHRSPSGRRQQRRSRRPSRALAQSALETSRSSVRRREAMRSIASSSAARGPGRTFQIL